MYTIVQFSPTGNSAYISELISNALGETSPVLALEHLDPNTLKPNKHLIMIFPIHAFNAPRTVKRFIKNLPSGLFEVVSLISVGCNTSWINHAVSKDIRKVLESKSYDIMIDEILAMPLTLVKEFPDSLIQDQIVEARQSVIQIAEDIRNNKYSSREIKFKSNIINFFGRGESFAARFWGLELHAKSNCTQCGLCVRSCPEKNIRMTNKGHIRFGFKCSMCIRCVYNCPVRAITPRISKFIPLSNGYSLEKHLEKFDQTEKKD